jgi:NAD-dependent SIR2 family protein deacetylase
MQAADQIECGSGIARRQIAHLIERGPLVVLSGAGLSTSCGIPDYRDREGRWKRPQPIDHQSFLRSPEMRRRYWRRSFHGWAVVGQAAPGAGHRALTQLEQSGRIGLIVTQNVDGLHQKAGSRAVLELHGGLARVVCLDCRQIHARTEVQDWIAAANPGIAATSATAAPDGDADLPDDVPDFAVPACPACGGMLKPDVVFFGDSVPRERVRAVTEAIDGAAGLLVVGSSLMVYSGFRFAEHAHRDWQAGDRGQSGQDPRRPPAGGQGRAGLRRLPRLPVCRGSAMSRHAKVGAGGTTAR